MPKSLKPLQVGGGMSDDDTLIQYSLYDVAMDVSYIVTVFVLVLFDK